MGNPNLIDPVGIDTAGTSDTDSRDDEGATERQLSKHASFLSRIFSHCPSGDNATIDITAEILYWNVTSPEKQEDMHLFFGIDMNAWCRYCCLEYDGGEIVGNRTIDLTTLNIGSVRIAVIDKRSAAKLRSTMGEIMGHFAILKELLLRRNSETLRCTMFAASVIHSGILFFLEI